MCNSPRDCCGDKWRAVFAGIASILSLAFSKALRGKLICIVNNSSADYAAELFCRQRSWDTGHISPNPETLPVTFYKPTSKQWGNRLMRHKIRGWQRNNCQLNEEHCWVLYTYACGKDLDCSKALCCWCGDTGRLNFIYFLSVVGDSGSGVSDPSNTMPGVNSLSWDHSRPSEV